MTASEKLRALVRPRERIILTDSEVLLIADVVEAAERVAKERDDSPSAWWDNLDATLTALRDALEGGNE